MLNKKILKKIGIGIGITVVPAAIIGGYFGMQNANPYYKYYRTPITGDDDGFISTYLSAIALGAKVILAPGYSHKQPLNSLFSSNYSKVKDVGFLLLDEAMSNGEPAAFNTWSITFRSDLGSFRTGVALCMFLNEYVDTFKTNSNDKLTFGTYGGAAYSSVVSFMGGVQNGINYFNKNLVGKNNPYVPGKTLEPIEVVYPKNYKINDNVNGGFGPSQGDSIIQQYLALPDLDAFMPVAGPQTWSAQRKIKELNKKTILIGVDSAIEEDPQNESLNFKSADGKEIGNGKYIQMSSIKNLNAAVVKALTLVNNGNVLPDSENLDDYSEFVDSSKIGGFGTSAVGNIKNKCVGVSPTGQPYYAKALELVGAKVEDSSSDPSLDPSLNADDKMTYFFGNNPSGESITFGASNPYGLKINFSQSYGSSENDKVLNLKGFITKNKQEDSNKIKIVLSTPTSVLFDSSFSQSAYEGLREWYRLMGINIPLKRR